MFSPVLASSSMRAFRAISPPCLATCACSCIVSGLVVSDIRVVESSANIVNTNSVLVILSQLTTKCSQLTSFLFQPSFWYTPIFARILAICQYINYIYNRKIPFLSFLVPNSTNISFFKNRYTILHISFSIQMVAFIYLGANILLNRCLFKNYIASASTVHTTLRIRTASHKSV
jgi:hypothetical protein